MLFLGTKKHPEEDHYVKYLTSNGGSRNAATGEDYTYYYFDVKNDGLNGTLNIFSEFFKEPLFDEGSTEREINAIESEFKKNVNNEQRKLH